ncbi:NERD domain-containing protein [Cryobacterium sp. TMT1-2-1]|nr:NERD domain-containing protein [Cryobacterium sp. TMT1-2-1]
MPPSLTVAVEFAWCAGQTRPEQGSSAQPSPGRGPLARRRSRRRSRRESPFLPRIPGGAVILGGSGDSRCSDAHQSGANYTHSGAARHGAGRLDSSQPKRSSVTTDIPTLRQRLAAQSVIERLLPLGRSSLSSRGVARYLGAKGERIVGSILDSLPPEWTVLHALPIGARSSAIDHLVVGPGGVFTISTKHFGSKVIGVGKHGMTVAGRPVPSIRAAEFEAARVTTLVRERMPLVAPVQPVIAVVEPKQLIIHDRPEQVKVVHAGDLRRWLMQLQPVLTEPELMELDAIVDGPGTWRSRPDFAPGIAARA